MFDDIEGWMSDGAFLGSYEDLAPGPQFPGEFLGAYEDMAPAEYQGALDFSEVPVGVPDALNRAADSQAAYGSGAAYATQGAGPLSQPSVLQQIMRGLRLTNKDGAVDLSDPKTLDAWMKTILGGANAVNALLGGNKPRGYKSPAEVRSSLASGFEKFSPSQQAWADKYFTSPVTIGEGRAQLPASQVRSTITPSRGYRNGGALGYVHGGSHGQADDVPANLSSGEYVMDADVVSAIGDGNNAAGAAMLDAWRENLRAHKRGAPTDKIPPQTKDLNSYFPKGALRQIGAE